jgi:hypothetical protein
MKEIAVMLMVGVAMNAPPADIPAAAPAPEACFCELNANVDAGVSLSEFCRRYGIEAEGRFVRADQDDDGILSEAEFAALNAKPDY